MAACGTAAASSSTSRFLVCRPWVQKFPSGGCVASVLKEKALIGLASSHSKETGQKVKLEVAVGRQEREPAPRPHGWSLAVLTAYIPCLPRLCICHLSEKLDGWPLSCDIGVPCICSITNLDIDAVGGEVLAQGIACL